MYVEFRPGNLGWGEAFFKWEKVVSRSARSQSWLCTFNWNGLDRFFSNLNLGRLGDIFAVKLGLPEAKETMYLWGSLFHALNFLSKWEKNFGKYMYCVVANLTADVLSSIKTASCKRDSVNFNLIDPSYYWSALDMRAASFREMAKSFSSLDNLVAKKWWFCETRICRPYRKIGFFTDTAAILNSFVSNRDVMDAKGANTH